MPDVRTDANGRARDIRGRFVSAPDPTPPLAPRVGLFAHIRGSSGSYWSHSMRPGTMVRIVERYQPAFDTVAWGVSCNPYRDTDYADYYVPADDLELLAPRPECPRGCPDGCPACDDSIRLCLSHRHLTPAGEACDQCEAMCPECGEPALAHRIIRLPLPDGTREVCRECRDNYQSCSDCGRWYRPEDGHDDCPYFHACEACEEGPFRPGARVIDNYSYRPDFIFHGNGPLFYGVEMEMEVPYGGPTTSTVARHLLNSIGDTVMAKSDGSLQNGIELVTHPMSFDYAMGHSRLWDALDSIRHLFGVENADRAGLHVHVSRAGFSGPTHVYRWIKFFHRNERDISRIARRRDSRWAAFASDQRDWAAHIAKYGPSAPQTAPRAWYAREKRRNGWKDNDRYRAINNTNPDTFEVRVFAGSVYPSEIRAALQLVHGSIEYTRTVSTKKLIDSRFDWEGFVGWVRDEPNTFRDLLELNATAPEAEEEDDRCGCPECSASEEY